MNDQELINDIRKTECELFKKIAEANDRGIKVDLAVSKSESFFTGNVVYIRKLKIYKEL